MPEPMRVAKDHAEAILTNADDNIPSKVIEHAQAILTAMGVVPATPIAGYTAQPDAKVALVNELKADEERLLRKLDALEAGPKGEFTGGKISPGQWVEVNTSGIEADRRWLAIARTHFQEGYSALNRAVFRPTRIKLPEDE